MLIKHTQDCMKDAWYINSISCISILQKWAHDIVKKIWVFLPWNFGLFYKAKRLKKGIFSKLANNSSKSGKRIKQMSIPPFWGDVGVKKWSPFLDSAAQSPIFGHLKVGTFPIFRCLKMGLWAPKSKIGDYFFTPTPPLNGGLHICFMCLPLLGEK